MTKEPTTELAPRPAIASGGALAALVPQNLDDAFRLAKALSSAGDMVPKHFQGKPEATMAAIIRGMEIGLAPMQALSNIAVINGRASVWGDALPALMQRAGHSIDVEITGEGDTLAATATLTRGDTGKAVVRTFTAADAKKAGLWGKQGPWQQYPKRMVSMRARSLACRDGAADALMGLQIAEEMRDAQPMRNVTPEPARGGWADQARKARGEVLPDETAQPDADEQTQEIEDAEEAEMATHWTADVDPSEGTPGSEAWDAGVEAFKNDTPITDCPHEDDMEAAQDWIGGYIGARRAAT
jgi:hypothetical protein